MLVAELADAVVGEAGEGRDVEEVESVHKRNRRVALWDISGGKSELLSCALQAGNWGWIKRSTE